MRILCAFFPCYRFEIKNKHFSYFFVTSLGGQVANEVKAKVQKKMSMVCGTALYCDVTDLEAICQDVLDDAMLKTNDILGRKRR
jgi:hypothetical protein